MTDSLPSAAAPGALPKSWPERRHHPATPPPHLPGPRLRAAPWQAGRGHVKAKSASFNGKVQANVAICYQKAVSSLRRLSGDQKTGPGGLQLCFEEDSPGQGWSPAISGKTAAAHVSLSVDLSASADIKDLLQRS